MQHSTYRIFNTLLCVLMIAGFMLGSHNPATLRPWSSSYLPFLGAGGSAVAIIVGTGVLGWLFDGYGTPSEKRWPLYIQMGLVYMGIIFGILISLKSRLMGEMCFLGWLASMCGALISGRIYLNKNEPGQRSKEPLALLIETLVLGGIGYVAVQLFIWTMR